MKLLLISGDGAGAGKTYAANKLGDETWSLASQIRRELKQIYPAYDWFNKTQAYKTTTLIKEWQDKALRRVLLEYGQVKCAADSLHWARLLAEGLQAARFIVDGCRIYAIDDVRKVCELEFLQERFGGTHIHVSHPRAVFEPEFEAEELKKRADYVITWA